MWETIHLAIVLGPGAFLLARWQFFEREPSRNALVVTLLWTYVMLFMQYNDRNVLADDHKEACQNLEVLLVERDPDAMEEPGSVDEWGACFRHSQEYLEAEADYRADQAANR